MAFQATDTKSRTLKYNWSLKLQLVDLAKAANPGTPGSGAAIAAFRGAQDRTVEDRIAEGVVAAVAAIDTGAATDLLTRWAALTQKLATS